MLGLLIRAMLVTAVLGASTLVFVEEIVMSALILVTVALAAVTLVLRPEPAGESEGAEA